MKERQRAMAMPEPVLNLRRTMHSRISSMRDDDLSGTWLQRPPLHEGSAKFGFLCAFQKFVFLAQASDVDDSFIQRPSHFRVMFSLSCM